MNEGPAHGVLYGGNPSTESRAVTRSTLRKMRPQP